LFATGKISYISPLIDKKTRTVVARIELKNPDFVWRPGTFVKGNVVYDNIKAEVLIPKSAIFLMDNEFVVFVKHENWFEHQPITLGKTDEKNVEVLSGILAGQEYVIEGGFELKAHIVTTGLGDHAGHGH
jgi:cobalt-zinc-cadmium efflux system membrane fusion protein